MTHIEINSFLTTILDRCTEKSPWRRTFFHMIAALIKCQHTILTRIAASCEIFSSLKAVYKRIQRFLASTAITHHLLLIYWQHFLLRQIRGDLTIIIDFTKFDGYDFLYAAIATHARAIPFHITYLRNDELPDIESTRNMVVEHFLLMMKLVIPDNRRVLIVADREFGRLSFMKYCRKLGFSYLIRIKGKVTITLQNKTEMLVKDIDLSRTRTKVYSNVYYKKRGKFQTNIIAHHEPNQKEPWYLVTDMNVKNTADRAVRLFQYAQRMWIEETFKDIKLYLNMEKFQCMKRTHILKLLVCQLYAYGIMYLIGMKAKAIGADRYVEYHPSQCSAPHVGMFILRKWQHLDFHIRETIRSIFLHRTIFNWDTKTG